MPVASTSSTSAPPGVLKEIEALLSWNPPLLVVPPPLQVPFPSPTKLSMSSRKPGFYDKHFSDSLVLKRVKRLPSLVGDLANTVDEALAAATPTLPPLSPTSMFFTTETRKKNKYMYHSRLGAKDEKAVASFFDQYTSKYCLPLASTLALHPTATFSDWHSLLDWTQSVTSSGYAIMDGELLFKKEQPGIDEDVKSHEAKIWATMEADNRHIFQSMRDSSFSLATWEIKNLGAGRSEVMSVVLNLGEFSWTTCPDIATCKQSGEHDNYWQKVGLVDVGPDAQHPPWSLSSPAEAGPSTYKASSSLSSLSSLTPLTSEDEKPLPAKKKGKKSKQSTKKKGKKRTSKRDEDDDVEERPKDKKKGHDVTAHDIVQQAWAQATRVDGTVIVLHSGNHEVVCVRERSSQTLYVSDVVEPHKCSEPGYGKILVGIYVAAIKDALDRKQQAPSVSQPGPPGDSGGGDSGGGDNQDNNRGSGSRGTGRRGGEPKGGRSVEKSDGLRGSAGGKGHTDDEQAIKKMMYEACNRDVVLMYFRYGVYDSPIPATFHRCPTPPFPPRTTYSYRQEECLDIVLTSEIGRGATGVVHRGTLMSKIWDDVMPMDVVVKLAFDVEQREALRSEYEIYQRLRLKGIDQGITTVLGFFNDSEDGASALAMLHAGVPLFVDSQSNLSTSDCKSALSTLKSIHRAGVLHGDVRPENVLISDKGITIIDFGHSKLSNNKRAKDEEFAQLRFILGLAGEGH